MLDTILAAFSGNADILVRLREAGDRVDNRMVVGGQAPMTPLSAAAEPGNTAVVRALPDLGALIDQGQADDRDVTPLDRAVLGNQLKTATLLIERGANVNHVDKFGMTPLLWAANVDFGDAAMIDLLLKSRADKDTRTKDGLTALDLARKYNHTHLVPMLTANG